MQWALQPLFMAISATLVALSCVFAWRHTLKPMLSLLLAAAAGAYFMLSYSIVIDSSMLVAAGAGRKWHLPAWHGRPYSIAPAACSKPCATNASGMTATFIRCRVCWMYKPRCTSLRWTRRANALRLLQPLQRLQKRCPCPVDDGALNCARSSVIRVRLKPSRWVAWWKRWRIRSAHRPLPFMRVAKSAS